MAARNASSSSESLALNESLLLPYSRACSERLSEASPASAYGSNVDAIGVRDTSAPLGSKSSSIILDQSYVRKENTVMRSCWIRRLNPACKKSDFEDKESRKSTHVKTHFNKYFCSFTPRLGKEHHLTRSLSWPPNKRTTKFPSQVSKTQEPVDIREQHYLLTRATSPNLREENLRVPYPDALESNYFCSKTKKSSQRPDLSLEAVVPCSHAARPWDNGAEGCNLTKSATPHLRWLAKDDGFAAGDFNSNFRHDSGSYQDVGFGRVVGKAFNERKFAPSNMAHRVVHASGCRSGAVSRSSFLSVRIGASADADDSLTKYNFPSKPFNLSFNSQAEVFADVVNKINEEQSEATHKKNIGIGCSKDSKSGRNFGFLHSVGRSRMLEKSVASPCECHGVYNGGCAAKRSICNRDSTVPTSHKSSQMNQSVGFNTAATNGGFSQPLRSLNKDSRRGNFSATREEDHWMKIVVEDSASVDLSDPSRSKVTQSQEHIMDVYRMRHLDQAANLWKPDERNKLHFFADPSHETPVNHPGIKLHRSWNVPEKVQIPACDRFVETMHSGLGHNRVSTDWSPSKESFMLRALQEEGVQVFAGETRRLVTQTNQIEERYKFSENEGRTANGPSRQSSQAWIQRWCSSSSSIVAKPGGALLLPSTRRNKELETDFLTETSIMASKLHMDDPTPRKRCHDVSLETITPRSTFSLYGSHASVRGKNIPPSIEAMAIVGNTGSKLHRCSMERSDSFLVWPSPSKENCQEREPTKHNKGTMEGTLQAEDMNDVEFFERNLW